MEKTWYKALLLLDGRRLAANYTHEFEAKLGEMSHGIDGYVTPYILAQVLETPTRLPELLQQVRQVLVQETEGLSLFFWQNCVKILELLYREVKAEAVGANQVAAQETRIHPPTAGTEAEKKKESKSMLNNPSQSQSLAVLLAYADQNLSVARILANQLGQSSGARPWLADRDVLPGENTDLALAKAIKSADVIIVLLSKAVEQRSNLNRQLRLAFAAYDEQPEAALFFIPVLLELCQVPAELTKLRPLDYTQPDFYTLLTRSLAARAAYLGVDLVSQISHNHSFDIIQPDNNSVSSIPQPGSRSNSSSTTSSDINLTKLIPERHVMDNLRLTPLQNNQLVDVMLKVDALTVPQQARHYLRAMGLPSRKVMGWDLPANPTALAMTLINKLVEYGVLPEPPYLPALGAFFQQLLIELPGQADKLFLEELLVAKRLMVSRDKLTWQSLEAIQRPKEQWRGVDFLYRGVRSTLAVCRVEDALGNPIGTGFLVKPNLVLTNYHVLATGSGTSDGEKAQSLLFHFGYIKEEGKLKTGKRVSAAQSGPIVISTSPSTELDYALIELADHLDAANFPALPLYPQLPHAGANVIILQHPEGMDMQFMQGQFTEFNTKNLSRPRLVHDANTLQGSSGSPVFDLEWRVIGLHSSGFKEVANYAVPMSAILDRIGEYF